jgi:site-specific recombinase XerD
MGGIQDVRLVSGDDLRQFILALQQKDKWAGMAQCKGKPLSPTSINTYVRAIKAFWSWLHREGIIEQNPLEKVPVPKLPQRLPKIYTEAEMASIFRAIKDKPRDRAIIELLLDSGIRLSELTTLKSEDCDDRSGMVRVLGKGGKERQVFISKETAVSIATYYLVRPEAIGEDRLFLSEDGRPLTNPRVQKMLAAIGKRAGLTKRLSPHKLRHTAATLSLKYGANLEYVRRILGHTDIKTTEVYLGVADTDVAEAHRKFSPVAHLAEKAKK